MNKLYVLAKNQETYFCQRLIKEVGKSSLNFINPWGGEVSSHEGRILVRTSAVYGGNQDLEFLKSWKGKILNPLEALQRFRSKSSQYTFFDQVSIPILPWKSLKNLSLDEALLNFGAWGERLLVKPDRGQGGWGVESLEAHEFKIWWQRGDHDFLLQPFIENAREFRTFFCDGMESITLERVGLGSVANFRQGGSAKLSKLNPATQALIEELRIQSQAQYGAIDFFETDHGPRILELNVCPGIEQLEALTGINVIQHVLANLRV